MDPMYDLDTWSKQRREEAIREAQRRSLAKQEKGDRRTLHFYYRQFHTS
jgi:hypothetical protein